MLRFSAWRTVCISKDFSYLRARITSAKIHCTRKEGAACKKVQRTANICRPNVYKISEGAAHRNIKYSKSMFSIFSSLSCITIPKRYGAKKIYTFNWRKWISRCTAPAKEGLPLQGFLKAAIDFVSNLRQLFAEIPSSPRLPVIGRIPEKLPFIRIL